MAATPIVTGHGATLTLATSTFTGSLISIGSFEQSREALDKTHLTSGDYKQYTPGDVAEPGQFVVDMFYDMNSQPPILGDAEVGTIKFVDSSTGIIGVGSASIAGSCFVVSWTHPEIVTGTLLRSQMTIQWATGPTFTDET